MLQQVNQYNSQIKIFKRIQDKKSAKTSPESRQQAKSIQPSNHDSQGMQDIHQMLWQIRWRILTSIISSSSSSSSSSLEIPASPTKFPSSSAARDAANLNQLIKTDYKRLSKSCTNK